VQVAQPCWLNLVTRQDIHQASGTAKIGPSRRRNGNCQQMMGWGAKTWWEKSTSGISRYATSSSFSARALLREKITSGTCEPTKFEEGSSVSDGHKRIPEAAAAQECLGLRREWLFKKPIHA
jgi:hypothetical protein